VPPWTPIILYEDGLRVALASETPDGITVPYTVGNAVLTNGSHDFAGYEVPAPNGSWLTQDGSGEWIWVDTKPLTHVARIFQQNIIMEDNMSYAIGSRDISDVREYTSVVGSVFGPSGPQTGTPVKADGSSICPATASDEVIIGVIKSAEQTSSAVETYDESGTPTGQTGTDSWKVIVQVAEGDLLCQNSFSTPGAPLFVQSYQSADTGTMSAMYGETEPSAGYSHALLTTVDANTVHFNGHSRPVAI
jgi:hypothetical protein